jgi:hypothetical protein
MNVRCQKDVTFLRRSGFPSEVKLLGSTMMGSPTHYTAKEECQIGLAQLLDKGIVIALKHLL